MAEVKVPVYSPEGQKVKEVDVPAEAFGKYIRPTLIHHAVVMYGANKRAGTASTKTRAEVAGSNRKPWPQKGTGRARAGTRKSPLWRGGGIIFGPKPRDWSEKMNRRQKRLATRSALLWKMADGELKIFEKVEVSEPKTKLMAAFLKRLGIEKSCLVGLREVPREVLLASRNIPGVKVLPGREFNA